MKKETAQMTLSCCIGAKDGKFLAVLGFQKEGGEFVVCGETELVDTIKEAKAIGSAALAKARNDIEKQLGLKTKRNVIPIG